MQNNNISVFVLSYLITVLFYSCDNEPYEGPLTFDNQITCPVASEIAATALINYLDSDSTNYEENCLAYRVALEEQLVACPEESDQILEQINNLNNCELNSFFQVDFDDDTYLANSAEAHMGNGLLTIKAKRDNEEFEIVLYETSEGTYQLGSINAGDNINLASYFPDINSNESWVSVSDVNEVMGEITVSEINYNNLSISGIFSFTGVNNNETKSFTNGVFMNIPLTKDDDFFALYDGQEYVESSILKFFFEDDTTIVIIILSEVENLNMDFAIDSNTTPGTYSFQLFPQFPRAGFTATSEFYYNANGTLIITAHNTDANFIMGTFEFVAVLENGTPESYTITEGHFCINY